MKWIKLVFVELAMILNYCELCVQFGLGEKREDGGKQIFVDVVVDGFYCKTPAL